MKVTQSCLTLCDPMNCLWNSLGQNTAVGSLSLLQRIFPIQGSNPGAPRCRWILYQLSHKGSPSFPEEFPEDLLHIYVVLFLTVPLCGTTLFPGHHLSDSSSFRARIRCRLTSAVLGSRCPEVTGSPVSLPSRPLPSSRADRPVL